MAHQLEYDFVVAPGADAGQIALEFTGAHARLAADGSLVLKVDGATLSFRRPVVYQFARARGYQLGAPPFRPDLPRASKFAGKRR
jgi:PAS domain S-box-containing protein